MLCIGYSSVIIVVCALDFWKFVSGPMPVFDCFAFDVIYFSQREWTQLIG